MFTRDGVNQRMSRDHLEFKRIVNRSSTYDEMALERRIFDHLRESMSFNEPEPGYYQAFLSPHQRSELLADLAEEMSALQSSFRLPRFPASILTPRWFIGGHIQGLHAHASRRSSDNTDASSDTRGSGSSA